MYKPMKVGDNLSNSRLLEHDFADPDAVWISIHAPGQMTAILVEPPQQLSCDARRL